MGGVRSTRKHGPTYSHSDAIRWLTKRADLERKLARGVLLTRDEMAILSWLRAVTER